MPMLCVQVSSHVLWLILLLAGHAQAREGVARRLREFESSSVTGVRIADFSGLPENVTTEEEVSVAEVQLSGTVDVSDGSSSGGATLHGTYKLGPTQVEDLARVISDELEPVPASSSAKAPTVDFPGVTVRGESVLDTLSAAQPLRIPTVFSPFHTGTVFSLQARQAPPGTTLTFSNMTLLLPNVTYDGIHTSGLMDFFDLGASARVCFTNSILALRSCEGFIPNVYHMWCCTAKRCNIVYTQQALADLGYSSSDRLEYLHCVSRGQRAHDPPDAAVSDPIVQEADTTSVRAADFAALPSNFTQETEVDVAETPLPGQVDVAASTGVPALYGAFSLSAPEVMQLAQLFNATQVPRTPQNSSKAPVVDFPGATIRGESVLDTLSTTQPLRIPTVFAPFYAGTVFTVAGSTAPPGAALTFSNMTLLLPNATYAGVHKSGFMGYFDLGASARVCFTNSILVLESCKGFAADKYHMWCCTAQQCNTLYTKKALEDLGFDSTDDLETLQCYSTEQSAGAVAAGGTTQPTTPPVAASGSGGPESAGDPSGEPDVIDALSAAPALRAAHAACWAAGALAVLAGAGVLGW